jgi:ribosomal protein S18 acetylase RimI-like enzyme
VTGERGIVRPAAAADAPAIGTVHVEAWRAAYRGLVPDAILDGFSIAGRIAHWRGALAARPADDPRRIWVAAVAGRVAGFATTGPARDESAPPPPGAGEIEAIYLEPELVGRGIGRALFARAAQDLTARGFDPLVVWVFEANPRARAFYEAAGFRVDGARHDIDFDGAVVPEIRYRLDGGSRAS